MFTPTPDHFEILENGCVVVGEQGKIEGVFASLPEQYQNYTFIDYGSKLLIPGMYDLHVHAPQYRNQGMAMDLELLPWLQEYTFPEEANYADAQYAQVAYQHFVDDLRRQGTVRAAVFATLHPEAIT